MRIKEEKRFTVLACAVHLDPNELKIFVIKLFCLLNFYWKHDGTHYFAGMSSISGIPEITRDAFVGNVALVIVSVTVVVLVIVAAAILFIRRKDWHLDGNNK